MARKSVPNETETAVLLRSRRRCCVCYGLNRDTTIKPGQIAHLDGDPSNNDEDNLVFLCFEHHDQYDSRTSQSKGLTEAEVRHFRAELYKVMELHQVEDTGAVEKYPSVDFDFRAEGVTAETLPEYVADLTVEVANAGEGAIQEVRLHATEYTLERRQAIVGMSGFGERFGLIADRVEPKGGTSGPRSIRDLLPLRLEKVGAREHGSSSATPTNERFYALRITFALTGSTKRFISYKVISAMHPYLFPADSNFGYSWAKRDSSIPDAPFMDWFERPKKIILERQRQTYASALEEEYVG